MAGCIADAQGRVVQIETQRVLALIAAGGKASAVDALDWLQSQPLDLLRVVSDVACALHRCCGGCRPKQVPDDDSIQGFATNSIIGVLNVIFSRFLPCCWNASKPSRRSSRNTRCSTMTSCTCRLSLDLLQLVLSAITFDFPPLPPFVM
jgi:hypothetical protein